MSIKIKLFASLAETLGRREIELSYSDGITVDAVWQEISADIADVGSDVLVAVNTNYCERDTPLQDGDEVAFFPPVTGG